MSNNSDVYFNNMSETIPIIPLNIKNNNKNNLLIYQNIPPPAYSIFWKIIKSIAVNVKHNNLIPNFVNDIDKGKYNEFIDMFAYQYGKNGKYIQVNLIF